MYVRSGTEIESNVYMRPRDRMGATKRERQEGMLDNERYEKMGESSDEQIRMENETERMIVRRAM